MPIFFFFTLLVSFLGFFILFKNTKQLRSSHDNNNHAPPSHPIIGCLVSFYQNRHRLLDWYTQHLADSSTQTIVVRRLGARRTIVTANPCNVEYILKTNFGNFPKGKPFTEILGDLLGCGIFNVDGELWHAQRKLASHEFTTRSLKDFIVKTLQEEVQVRLIPLLENAARENHVIDLQDVLRRLTFDAVCKVSLGYDPCCLDMSSRSPPPLFTAFDTASAVSAARGAAPVFLVWKMKRMLNLGSEKALKEAVKMVHDSVAKIIESKKEGFTARERNYGGSDLLDRLLEAGQEETVVRDMVISMIMAGRDTTSAAMTWLFWLLSNHREHESSLVREISCTSNQSYECLKEMKFLKACLCESMRLYPPVAWDSKHAAGADVLPDGTHVAKGDRVTYFPYGMGRMEALWGEDCCEFKPQRWFHEENVENGVLKCVNAYKFPVFQAGPRVCLGREMAFIQMEYVVASILKRFVIAPVCDESPRFVPLLTAHMAGGFKVRVHNRTESEK